MSDLLLYVSGWKEHGGTPGIQLFSFDSGSGQLEDMGRQWGELSCGCTAYDEEKRILYITNELHENPDYVKGGGGLVWAFDVSADGTLVKRSRAESACPCPAYISLSRDKKHLLCANHSGFSAVTKAKQGADGTWHTAVEYDDALVGVFRLETDGSIGVLIDVAKHDKYPVSGRGLHSRPHTIVPSPDGKLYACCDKGDGHIYMYKLSGEGKLALSCEPFDDNEGATPRYCVFHPDKKYLYVNHERDMRVCSFAYGENGELTKLDTVSALAPEAPRESAPEVRRYLHGCDVPMPADGFMPLEQQGLCISRDGCRLYTVINGADAVSVFALGENGDMRLLETVPVEGRWARACALSPDGRFLAVCCLQSGDLRIFPVDSSGRLGAPVASGKAPGGSYITFIV